jgi:cytochrome c biogenesis protein CcdA
MDADRLAYAFTVGMVAAVNPCGFALLPAYLAYYLGLTDDTPEGRRAESGTATALVRAVWVSAALTAGFVVVFGVIGVLWSSIDSAIGGRLPWVTAVMGVALVALGIAMLAGFEPILRLPRLDLGKGGQQAWSVFLFGVSYGVASLGCTIGLYLAAVGLGNGVAVGTGISTFVAYALGMGALITLLTLAVALARQGLVQALRRALPYMGRISGALLIPAGLLVAYAGWSEAEQLGGRSRGTGLFERLQEVQGDLTTWIQQRGPGRIGLIALVIVVAVVGIGMLLRGRGATRS